jgi:DNA-binding MarR family transcriptional regulator
MTTAPSSRPIACYIPKYEHLKQFLERFPAGFMDPVALGAYVELMGVSEYLHKESLRKLAPFKLGEGRAYVLAILSQHEPASLSHSHLAELMGVTKGNITGLVDGLQHDGYVQRDNSREDRRVMSISLTTAGRKLIGKALHGHLKNVATLMSVLTATERKTLVGLLSKLRSSSSSIRTEG